MASLMTTLRSSGDLGADRRYDYACAALAEGDAAGAADLCEQALALAPVWAPAWFALGEAREALGDRAGATQAFARALACAPDDAQGAGLRLARLSGETPAHPPLSYVRELFDQYAPRFERHLVDELAYRAPAILKEALARACAAHGRALRFAQAVDLGCGTGLMAREIAPFCDALAGVDLAPAMAARARASGLYAQVEAGDMTEFLATRAPGSVDLVVAADVFVYLGDLAPVFAQTRRALAPGGFFAFTLQRAESGDYRLGEDLRFAHSADYLAALARRFDFMLHACDNVSVRRDRGVDVPGLALVLAAP